MPLCCQCWRKWPGSAESLQWEIAPRSARDSYVQERVILQADGLRFGDRLAACGTEFGESVASAAAGSVVNCGGVSQPKAARKTRGASESDFKFGTRLRW